jgi:hypothetical protein
MESLQSVPGASDALEQPSVKTPSAMTSAITLVMVLASASASAEPSDDAAVLTQIYARFPPSPRTADSDF